MWKWLAGIAASVIAALLISYLTTSREKTIALPRNIQGTQYWDLGSWDDCRPAEHRVNRPGHYECTVSKETDGGWRLTVYCDEQADVVCEAKCTKLAPLRIW